MKKSSLYSVLATLVCSVSLVNGICESLSRQVDLNRGEIEVYNDPCSIEGSFRVGFVFVENPPVKSISYFGTFFDDGVQIFRMLWYTQNTGGVSDELISDVQPDRGLMNPVTAEFTCQGGNNNLNDPCQGIFKWKVVTCSCPAGQQVITDCVHSSVDDMADVVCMPTMAPTTSMAPTVSPQPTSSPPSSGGGGGKTCFSGDAFVQVEGQGATPMKALVMGSSKVLTRSGRYQTVYAWAHLDHTVPATYLQIHTTAAEQEEEGGGGKRLPLEISSEHMVFVKDPAAAGPIRAGSVAVGDVLVGMEGRSLEVTKITTVHRLGAYAPLTEDGTIIVNGVVASNYVAIMGNNRTSEYVQVFGGSTWTPPSPVLTHEALAHAYMSPLRLVCRSSSNPIFSFARGFCKWHNSEGVHVYLAAGEKLVAKTFSWSIWAQLLVVVLALVATAPFLLMEVAFTVFPYCTTIAVLASIGTMLATRLLPVKIGITFHNDIRKKKKSV